MKSNSITQSLVDMISNKNQQFNPENIFMMNHMKYITGRSIQNYLNHIFPSFKTQKELIAFMKNKKLLDLGSGLNHLINNSLLSKINKEHNTWAKGLDIVSLPPDPNYIEKSLFDTKIKSNSVDIIISQFVLYSHINSIKLLKKAFTEIHRILKREENYAYILYILVIIA